MTRLPSTEPSMDLDRENITITSVMTLSTKSSVIHSGPFNTLPIESAPPTFLSEVHSTSRTQFDAGSCLSCRVKRRHR